MSTPTLYTDQVPVAHACNPSYLGVRDQEDGDLKSTLGKEFTRPYLEKNITKKGWWSGSRYKLSQVSVLQKK
jgi:hypothetical protein